MINVKTKKGKSKYGGGNRGDDGDQGGGDGACPVEVGVVLVATREPRLASSERCETRSTPSVMRPGS